MEAKQELNQILKLKPVEQKEKIIIKPFENYKSYNKYYKASVIYNTEFIRPQLTIMKSYDTHIAIYNRSNGFLILNSDWYNCSKTTKEQLDFFKFKYIPAFIQGVIYLSSEKFEDLINIFYAGNVGLYENKEDYIIQKWKAQKAIINTIENEYLTTDEKIQELLPINPESITKEQLKTRYYHIETINKHGVKFQIKRTWKGTQETCKHRTQDLIREQIVIISKVNLYQDTRNQSEKNLYSSYDMGIPNNKQFLNR